MDLTHTKKLPETKVSSLQLEKQKQKSASLLLGKAVKSPSVKGGAWAQGSKTGTNSRCPSTLFSSPGPTQS